MSLFDEIIKAIEEEVEKCDGPSELTDNYLNAYTRFGNEFEKWARNKEEMREFWKTYRKYAMDSDENPMYGKKDVLSDIDEVEGLQKEYDKFIKDFAKQGQKLDKYIRGGVIVDYPPEVLGQRTGFVNAVDGMVEWGVKNKKDFNWTKDQFVKSIEKNGKNAMEIEYIKKTDKGWVANVKNVGKEVPIILNNVDKIKDRIKD